MPKELSIRRLKPSDARAVARAAAACAPGYMRFYSTFSFAEASLRPAIARADKDRYWGIFAGKTFAGYFMLRGLDAGYAVPAYGVFIPDAFSGLGLSRLALQYAVCWCRMRGIKEVMLKCHPTNTKALGVYRAFGFTPQGPDARTGDVVFHKQLAGT